MMQTRTTRPRSHSMLLSVLLLLLFSPPQLIDCSSRTSSKNEKVIRRHLKTYFTSEELDRHGSGDLGFFGQLIGKSGLGTSVDDEGLTLILAGLDEQVFVEEFQAYYQQPGHRRYEVGERPKFDDLFIGQISDPIIFRRFILNGALSDYRQLTLSQRVDYDLVDFTEFAVLTLTEMEQIVRNYNAVGESWVVHPGRYPEAEIWVKHPELYQLFVDVAMDPEELKFYLGKLDRLFEIGLEEERQRSKVTLVGTTDKASPEYQTKLDEHRKKTKDELFDEIRDILTRRGVNVTHDVPPYLWELSRIRVLREIQSFMDSGNRWSERLVLEDFFVSIRGASTATPPFGWLDDDYHHCDWEGVTCGVTNKRDVNPRCLELCNLEGCPVGIFEANEQRRPSPHDYDPDYSLTRTYKVYCPKSRIDPPLEGVTMIELTKKNLQGTLSPFLYHLKWLHKLHLFDNKIQGTIPDSYGAFHSMQSMDMENNLISGKIPWSLSQLKETLRELWLGGNRLGGALPPDLRELHLLEYFGVAGNQLTGEIPLCEDMVSLLSFVANDNALTGNFYPYWPGNIELLNVANNELTGTFSDKFSALDTLLEINAENNRLSGRLYVQPLSRLHRLVALKLGNNDLSGEINYEKKWWDGTPELELIEMQNNSFDGPWPIHLFDANGKSEHLRHIDLSGNSFEGTIPSSVQALKVLRKLDLAYNKGSGTLDFLGNIGYQYQLNVTGNKFTGEVPDSLCGKTNRVKWSELWVACDSIACPPGFFHPDGASNFRGGCLKCTDPPEPPAEKLVDDTGLEVFVYAIPKQTRLGQSICHSRQYVVGDLNADGVVYEHEALRLIWSSTGGRNWSDKFSNWNDRANTKKCDYTGVTCNKAGDVVTLDLRGANLCKDAESDCWGLPKEILALEHLEELYISGNSFFKGTIPKELGLLKQLKVLDTSRCIRLGGTIPPELSSLKSLVSLNLSECNWSGSIPTELAQLTSLEQLNIGLNHQMSGPLPENIGDLHSIKEILLSRLNLSSTIPHSLGNLTNLENLELYGNKLEGELPNLSANKNLKRIDLFNCRLSGSFPFSLTKLPMLQIIHLKSNRLEGTLPSEIGSLGMLSWFDVSMNQIIGTIPQSFSNLQNLRDLRLGGNMLSDPIPEGLCSSAKVHAGLAKHCGCDAIICPVGSYSAMGFAPGKGGCTKCPEGETTRFLGSTECQNFTQQDFLGMFYDAVGAEDWWPMDRREGWKDTTVSKCEWKGVVCDANGDVIALSIPMARNAQVNSDGRAKVYASRTILDPGRERPPKFDFSDQLKNPSPEIERILGQTFEDLKAYYVKDKKKKR
mmetsp:Transcript_17405/g.49822  ORF Transcript_17405/g.49822 Transcript_17405/m.49822 type:complete len:1322 (-) Transcript_17405:68-4033(-)|eukprot:CAMPEP_0181027910 /NCGR_PEP_ID=MMETSP1070-20121207/4402_1 /TAXON_ID=265543 /ORGANISM="Minutocellus polymorphus, Strain NH13" /LENGTH=1321 /DNA_ID=CAMNT_0023105155 /DNA_START=32 /DNA_END=3997 /DNA_ORIENTATION=+